MGRRWLVILPFGALATVCLLNHFRATLQKADDEVAISSRLSSWASPLASLQSGSISVAPSIRQNAARLSTNPDLSVSTTQEAFAAAEFQETVERANGLIPSVSRLRGLPSEALLHHASPDLMRAGRALGAVAQVLRDHPSLAPQGENFYLNCAREVDYPTSVRALCYGHLRDPHQAIVPDAVKLLAERIPRA